MKLKRRILRAYYAAFRSGAEDYVCVFCGKGFTRFLPSGSRRALFKKLEVVGAGRRDNATCPNCFSKHRARLLYLFLKERTSVFTERHRLLHIAPDEHLADSLFRADTVDYVCGGLHIERLERFNAIKIDVTNIPFGPNEFDVVLCNHVMEYVIDEAKGFAEIHRVLRPGGFAILQVPIALGLEKTRELPPDVEVNRENTVKFCGHSYVVRLHGLDYQKRLEDCGFAVTRHDPFKEHWMPDLRRHALDPREEVFVAVKNP